MNQVMNRGWSGRAAACVGLLATAAAVHGQGHVFHVDDDAPAGGNGMSWATAFRDLQDALGAVLPVGSPPRVVKIAQGVYLPDRGTGNRESTFQITSATTLLGGYAGWGTADPDERDPSAFITVLLGDLAGNDVDPFQNREDNVYHVVTAVGGLHELNGLTVAGGWAREPAWGHHHVGGGLTIVGWNRPRVTVRRCVFENNGAEYGGAIGSVWDAQVVIEESVLRYNRAYDGGGAVRAGEIEVHRSVFLGNRANGGGAIYSSAAIDAIGSLFTGNTASRGGALFAVNAFVRITQCTFASNYADGGTCIQMWPGSACEIVSSILDSDGPGPVLSASDFNVFDLRSCIARGGVSPHQLTSASFLSMDAVIDTSPRFADPLGLDGIAGTEDDDYRLLPNSPAIDAAWYDSQAFPDLLTGGDLAGQPRVHDDPGMPNIGIGAGGAMDIGAYEFQGTSCRADHDGDGVTDDADIIAYLVDWFAGRAEADFDRDREHEVADIYGFLTSWFAQCP